MLICTGATQQVSYLNIMRAIVIDKDRLSQFFYTNYTVSSINKLVPK